MVFTLVAMYFMETEKKINSTAWKTVQTFVQEVASTPLPPSKRKEVSPVFATFNFLDKITYIDLTLPIYS